MKKTIILLGIIIIGNQAESQVLKRLADRAKNKMEQKAGDKVDQSIDEAVDGSTKKEKTDSESASTAKTSDKSGTNTDSGKEGQMKFNSKYDFVPGEKVVAFEDFSNTEVGDFPLRWNTDATAEVVTIEGKEGKWLKFNKTAVFYPEFIKDLPENFTLEFDVAVNKGFGGSSFVLNMAELSGENDFQNYAHNVSWKGRDAIHIELRPGFNTSGYDASSRLLAAKEGNYRVNNNVTYASWDNKKNNFAHVAVWRQKTRLRVYVNGEKIWDIPRAFDPAARYNGVTFAADYSYNKEDYYIFSNIRLAIGAPDTRNKLITEGKFVTTGITFDVNSDRIRPDSYGVLKEIATALKENPGVKVKITGHTDTDGDEKANLELSKKRAAAVKAMLNGEFGIAEDRMLTDGLGESKPVSDNKTPEGKAMNRRVEFVKL